MNSIGIKFPFQDGTQGGIIVSTQITSESIRSDLTAFLTMKKHQRVMNNNLYSPLYDYIFEQWDPISEDALRSALMSKIQTYITDINVNEILFNYDAENTMVTVMVQYSIPSLGNSNDSVSISLPITQ